MFTTPPLIQPATLAFRKPESHVMPNGIPFDVIHANGLDALRIDFVFAAGQRHQTHKLQAFFANRMLREGCRGYSAATFAERLDYYGAWLELSTSVNHSFVTLYTLKKHATHTLELVHRMLTEPTYDAEQFSTLCTNYKAHLQVRLRKGNVLGMRALRRNVYGDEHPCGMQAQPEDYDLLPLTEVQHYYRRHYGSRTCSIHLSGDVDSTLILHVEQLFGVAEWGSATPLMLEELPQVHNQVPCHQVITNPGALQDSIFLGTLLMDVHHADYLPMRVLTTILGGYFGSRLMKNVRETKGYTYHIGADLLTNTPQALLMVHCEGQAGKAEEIIAEVHREMLRLHSEPVPDDELLMVRNYLSGDMCRNYESAFALTDAYILLGSLGLPQTHLDHIADVIRTIDSTHLQQLAQRYLRPESLYSVVVKG